MEKKSYPIFKLDKESFVGSKVLNKNENSFTATLTMFNITKQYKINIFFLGGGRLICFIGTYFLNRVNIPPTRRLYFIERAQVEQ